MTLIQGEGLLNDATALTILGVAIAAAQGDGFSAPGAVGQFLVAAVGGVAMGLAVAVAIRPLRRLRTDPLSSNAISLATPFVAYLLGEAVDVSGVLAVVIAGLVIGHNNPSWASGASRLQTNAVWRLVDFLLEGIVFLLIGQQLPSIIDGLGAYEASTIWTASLITVGVVLLLRPLWLWLTEHMPQSLHMRLSEDVDDDPGAHAHGRLTGREIVALSWAGTRGVISLAAIFSLPRFTESGAPFPDRDLLLFCALLAVLVTLVGQGLTFAPMVRLLGIRADQADEARLRNEARAASVEAGLARLTELEVARHDHVDDEAIAAIRVQAVHPSGALPAAAGPAADGRGRRDPDVAAVRGGAAGAPLGARRAARRAAGLAGHRPAARREPAHPRARAGPRGAAAPGPPGALSPVLSPRRRGCRRSARGRSAARRSRDRRAAPAPAR
ncbi:cation:proton antiporter [Blastococcus sp. TML/C7B]|nr:cation:proton antiporter [Blastococcus sp. TML/C7B]